MSLNSKTRALLQLMSNGAFHSGVTLGETLGVSRAAIWKMLDGFSGLGLEVQRVRGKGYRICGGVDFLNDVEISRLMSSSASELFSELLILPEVISTNQVLLDRINSGEDFDRACVCLAEMQTAGRGRRGRKWQSPFAKNVYLSFSWCFENGIAGMEGLSLAVGLGVAKSLKALGVGDIGLKWPNDIICDEAKLGGILIEIAGDVGGRCQAVIGVGVNVSMSEESMKEVDQPWIDLGGLLDTVPSRNKIVASLLENLLPIVGGYESKGFEYYRLEWQELCRHIDQMVSLETSAAKIKGKMLGVDSAGSLRLEVEGKEQTFIGGEISLRFGV